MEHDPDLSVIANLEDKAFVDENVAIVLSDEMDVALGDCEIAMKYIVELVEPDFRPGLEFEALVVRKVGVAANEVRKRPFLARTKGL